MKKFLFLIFIFIFSCAPHLLRDKSLKITPGQSKQDVLKILGPPGNRQFNGKNEAWQWCETDYSGIAGDDYLIVWFYNGKVTGISTYKNSLYGSCEKFFRTIRWEEAPDQTIEIRNR